MAIIGRAGRSVNFSNFYNLSFLAFTAGKPRYII